MGDAGIENPSLIKVHHRSEKAEELISAAQRHSRFPENVWLVPNHVSHIAAVVPLGHVRLLLTVRPIQPVDLKIIRTGGYKELRDRDFITIGSEGVGTIIEIGEDVDTRRLQRNQRVVPVLFWDNLIKQGLGSWQYYVDVAEENVMVLPDVSRDSPDYIPDEAAAQFIITPWTALGLFHSAVAGIPTNGFLLLSAPSSTIGRHILGIGKNSCISVIAVVRKDDQKKLLQEMGVKHVININCSDFTRQVKSITGEEGAYAAIDGVGADTTKKLGACLRNGGEVLIYANAAGTDADDHVQISLSDLKRKIQVKWWTLTDYLHIGSENKEDIGKGMQQLFHETLELYRKKVLLFPTYEKLFKFSELAEALDLIEATKTQFEKRKAVLINHDHPHVV
ncbi:hypothetical protein R1sor_001222 [Riccia sorocarpa]|uniref:Alcohol dehydrogenase-like C-terminal domain-containing protein n=1 Tax=Riccia sorocarpa TaxID=122646 RepID=A0ABD3GYM2_9MARC